MCYRHSLSIRATLLARRFNPSFTYLTRININGHDKQEDFRSTGSSTKSYLTQRRYLGSCLSNTSRHFSGAFCQTGCGLVRNGRYMSTSTWEADMTKYADQVANLINDTIAAADTAFPVASVQYLINGVHSLTGLNWFVDVTFLCNACMLICCFAVVCERWASIVVSTLLVRGVTVPFLILMLKANSKLMLMRPRLEEIQEQIQAKCMKPQAIDEGKKKMKELFDEYGVTPSTPYKEVFIQCPVIIISYLAIANMTMKIPSFETGGALWFTNLITPDEMYIFPVLTALTFLVPVEFKLQKGHTDSMSKIDARVLALLSLPFSMILPKAISCYWITSNIFSLCYESIIQVPKVKKALGIPEIPSTENHTRKTIHRKRIKKR
ncbi:hypothetical protein V2J09_020187 [Rumex salicifolius]